MLEMALSHGLKNRNLVKPTSHVYLEQDVRLTVGAKRATLFRQATGDIFWITNDATRFLQVLLSKRCTIADAAIGDIDECVRFISELREAGLVCLSLPLSPVKPDAQVCHTIRLVWYEVTHICNLRCLHCYEQAESHTFGMDTPISLPEEIRLLSDVHTSGVRHFQFIGGEPFIDKERLMALCGYACGLFDTVEVFSNCTLPLSNAEIIFFRDHKIVVAFSLYSHIEKVHDCVTRIPGSYERTMGTARRLRDAGVKVRVAIVEMRDNSSTIANTLDFIFQEFGLRCNPDPVRLCGRAGVHLLNESVVRKKIITKKRFARKYPAKEYFFNQQYHNCYGRKLFIASNGDVFPCVMEKSLCLGNVWNTGWANILESRQYRIVRSFNKDKIEICRDCEFRYFCHDCRPDAKALNGDPGAQPWYCGYWPYEGEWNEELVSARIKEARRYL